jgi:two-component system sensor histidine kinase BaeS
MFIGFFMALTLGVLLLITVGAALAWLVRVAFTSWLAIGLAPLLFFVAIAVIVRSARRTWRPVGDLVRAAGSLADGDYTARVRETGPASVRPVARSFNQMAQRLETADEQRRRLLADLGHELRTPLTVVRGEIESMLDGVHRPDPEHLELLLDEVAVMERLLEDLRTLSLAEAGALGLELESTDLADLVSDVADGYRRSAAGAGVTIEADGEDRLPEIVVDPVRIREVVTNLVVNALRAMPEGGRLTLGVRQEPGEQVITVVDTGVGIDPDETPVVFERFRKGSTSSGSGLGLTISRDLVRAHGGTISLTSTPGRGTTVEVRLPTG